MHAQYCQEKKSWGAGPWQDEKDYENWIDETTGYFCEIVRQAHSGNLCGYVTVPSGHQLWGKSYSDTLPETPFTQARVNRPIGNAGPITILTASLAGEGNIRLDVLIDVHGSLTYSCRFSHGNGWTFGFDCAHAGDLSPAYAHRYDWRDGDTYRDFAYVRSECAKLALQLRDIAIELCACPPLHTEEPAT